MNKKVSTLLMMGLLAGAVGTAHAASDPVYAKVTTAGTAAKEIKENGLYQLQIANKNFVISMVEKDGAYVLKAESVSGSPDVKNTLWSISRKQDEAGNYSYRFVNYATGLPLEVDAADAYVSSAEWTGKFAGVGGDVSEWQWVVNPDNSTSLCNGAVLKSAFGEKKDSVLYVTGNGETGEVAMIKVPAAAETPKQARNIKAAVPAPVVLGVDDLNSMLWSSEDATAGVKFTFTPNVVGSKVGNLFTSQTYMATEPVGYPFAAWTEKCEAPEGAEDGSDTVALVDYRKAINAYGLASSVAGAIGSTDADVKSNAIIVQAFITSLTEAWSKDDAAACVALIAAANNTSSTDEGKKVEEAVRAALIAYVKAEGNNKPEDIKESLNTIATELMSEIESATVEKINAKLVVYETAVNTKKTAADAKIEELRAAAAACGWVSLKVAEGSSKGKYLMADTTYLTKVSGNENLAFALKSFKDVTKNSEGFGLGFENKTRLDLNGRYNFQFVWYPENDSISARVAGFAKLTDATNQKDIEYYRDMELAEKWAPAVTNQEVDPSEGNDEKNLIEIVALAAGHTEVTVGSSAYAGPNNYTVNAKITIGGSSKYKQTTVEEGVYLIQYVSNLAYNKDYSGRYFVGGILDNVTDWYGLATPDVQDYTSMPAAQWIVTKDKYADRYTIVNREDGNTLKINNDVYTKAYIYEAGKSKYEISLMKGDTIKLTPVTGAAIEEANVGYLGGSQETSLKEKKFALNYFNAIDDSKFINMTEDSTLVVDIKGNKLYFAFDSVGYEVLHTDIINTKGDTIVKSIKRNKYVMYVAKNNDNTWNERLFVYRTDDGKGYHLNTLKKENGRYPEVFYVAEWNSKDADLKAEAAAKKYYALFKVWSDDDDIVGKVGVKDADLTLTYESANEVRTSAFALVEAEAPEYRHLGVTIEDGIAKNDTAYVEFFMANEPTRFLYENTQNRVAANGTKLAADSLNYLGVYNKADLERNASIFVDTAYVVRGENNTKPLYMLASAAEHHAATAGDTCLIHGTDCDHYKAGVKGYIKGRYLVALESDSTDNNKSAMYQSNARLAFVDATHIGDSLIIANSEYTGVKGKSAKDTLAISKKMNPATFAFRLVDDSEDADFYIEAAPDDYWGAEQYVRIHNGVPVLVWDIAEAATFNVQKSDVKPTANETIAAEGVKVIAGEGFVTVKGAAGKKVVIANVLGQTVANTIVSSDEAQIAAPAGVVIVAVEGEAAQKAVVK